MGVTYSGTKEELIEDLRGYVAHERNISRDEDLARYVREQHRGRAEGAEHALYILERWEGSLS